MFLPSSLKKLLGMLSVAILIPASAVAQNATTNAPGSSTSEALATAMTNNGWAEARLVSAARDGDNLLIRVRFFASEGVSGTQNIYSSVSQNMWENEFYIVSGNKKYLILKDGAGKVLAPTFLTLRAGTPQAGSWSATFPAPPVGERATLHMHGIEPLGPFTVPE